MNSAKALASLLQNGVKVRYAEQPFTTQGINFEEERYWLHEQAINHWMGN
ncbi:MAG: hypothetical protein IPP79_24340 [Chitinophagaceae bacterium]|nr:hypothetical protein [Chitinophagaceae bacterium]